MYVNYDVKMDSLFSLMNGSRLVTAASPTPTLDLELVQLVVATKMSM